MSNPPQNPKVPDAIFSNDPFAEENPYEVLGLDRNADRAKIKSSYRAIQKRAKRGEETWMKAQLANEALTKPRKRLAIDLFTVRETRLHQEIVRRYGELRFELVPRDIVPQLMQASDLEWGDPTGDFAVPQVPRVIFETMMPAPPRENELGVPDRKK